MLLYFTNKEAVYLRIMLNMAKDYEFESLGIYHGETEEKANKLIEKIDRNLDKEKYQYEAIKKH